MSALTNLMFAGVDTPAWLLGFDAPGERQLSQLIDIQRNRITRASWRPEYSPDSLYFITISINNHNKILSENVSKQIVLDHFDCMRRTNQILLFSFVVMPTHIHFIAKISDFLTTGDFMRNFKSLSANRIKRYLVATELNGNSLIGKIWEDNYNAKEIYSTSFLLQKFDYIHRNPCKSPWKLAEKPEDYPWSSARFYLTNKQCIIPIDDLRDYLSPE